MSDKRRWVETVRWTTDEELMARWMWLNNHTGTEIGKAIGRTRSSVLGFLNRNNLNTAARALHKKQQAEKQPERVRLPVAEGAPTMGEVLSLPPPDRGPYTGPRVWTTRLLFECQFPVSGDGADTFSCCEPIKTAFGYCPAHRKRMYSPSTYETKGF
jgi:hypothetical protein